MERCREGVLVKLECGQVCDKLACYSGRLGRLVTATVLAGAFTQAAARLIRLAGAMRGLG
jgi:hypothetical protein